MQSLATCSKVYDVAQAQQNILERIDLDKKSWLQEQVTAREVDGAEYKNSLDNATSTIECMQNVESEFPFEGQVRERKDLVEQLKLVSFACVPCF